MESPSYDIFLSYPGGGIKDSANVRRLGEELEQHGLRPWIAGREHGHLDGESKAEILEVLAQAPIFVSCLGVREQRQWGEEEIAQALRRAKQDPYFRTCALLLPGSDPERLGVLPPSMRSTVFDLREGLENVDKLVAFCRH